MELQHTAPILAVTRNQENIPEMSAPARPATLPHTATPHTATRPLHCACCGRPFVRPSTRGPAPLYCSVDCQKQMRVRSRVWSRRDDSPFGLRRAS